MADLKMMAIYYTDEQKNQIRGWLMELRSIVTPANFSAHRDRARELVGRLDKHPTHPACLIASEFSRLRRIWQRIETEARQAEKA